MYFKFLVLIVISFFILSCDSNKTVRVSLSDSSNDVTDQDTTDDAVNDSDEGDTGDTGDSTDTGNTANTGNTADTGDSADTGNTGDTVDTGNTGDTVDTGNTGDTVDTGNTGDTTDTGNTGDSTDTGNTGTECSGDETRTIPCGSMGQGTQDQICMGGFWGDVGGCVLPQGAWDCIGNVCTPVFNAASCGNGTCEAKSGESAKSCPADCDMTGLVGTDQDCSEPIDCAFYDWPSSKKGYWECKSPQFNQPKKCSANTYEGFCGTNGNDYCYYSTTGTAALETDKSCFTDCNNRPLGQGKTGLACGSRVDCIFVDWPNL